MDIGNVTLDSHWKAFQTMGAGRWAPPIIRISTSAHSEVNKGTAVEKVGP